MTKKKNKNKWIVGVAVIAVAVLGMSLLSLTNNSVYFFTPDEAYARAAEMENQDIKVAGMVKVGSQKWNPKDLDLQFVLTDMKGHEINVKHKGTPPDMFKEGSGVVTEGRISSDGKSFISHNLLVKHSEEYKAPGDQKSMDKELLQESIFKKPK